MSEERDVARRWQVQIPEGHYGAFARIITLSNEDFQNLVEALRATAPTLNRDDFVRQIAEKVNLGRSAIADIVAMAISLQIVRTDMQVPIAQFVDVVMEALEEVPAKALGTAAKQRQTARGRIQAFLEIGGALATIAKANDLVSQHERKFLDARILTDLRPLFADDPTDHPASAIVVHTLKLTYVQEYERRDFFMALDAAGVRKLHEILARAEGKADAIASTFGESVHILKEEIS